MTHRIDDGPQPDSPDGRHCTACEQPLDAEAVETETHPECATGLQLVDSWPWPTPAPAPVDEQGMRWVDLGSGPGVLVPATEERRRTQ